MLTTAHGVWCSGSTLGTLERCQRPLPMSPSAQPADAYSVDAPSAGGEGSVIWNVISTRTRFRNTCNVKTMTSGLDYLGLDVAGRGHSIYTIR